MGAQGSLATAATCFLHMLLRNTCQAELSTIGQPLLKPPQDEQSCNDQDQQDPDVCLEGERTVYSSPRLLAGMHFRLKGFFQLPTLSMRARQPPRVSIPSKLHSIVKGPHTDGPVT